MPELPEVQTFINHLKPLVTNHKIIGVEINMDKVLKNIDPDQFSDLLMNQKFIDLTRLGKYLIFHLSNNKVMSLHLRMEGKPFYQHKNDPYEYKHVLFRIMFDNDYELRYHDTRRFGTVHIYEKNNYLASKELSKLGYDPLNSQFDGRYLKKQLLKSSKKAIKTTLLDQTKVAGIGNIYVDEILFATQLHPRSLVKDLKNKDFENLAKASTAILQDAVLHHGTTILSFKYKHGETGTFQNKLKVHTRKNQPCFVCNSNIQKIKVNGRGTYFCDKCQKLVK